MSIDKFAFPLTAAAPYLYCLGYLDYALMTAERLFPFFELASDIIDSFRRASHIPPEHRHNGIVGGCYECWRFLYNTSNNILLSVAHFYSTN